ncbi:hypothetical protein [Corynebacterium striatum]|nr:conserved hypothetical protein [Corynebacterium striatum]
MLTEHTVYRHYELEYEMTVTNNGTPQGKDAVIEYTGHGDGPVKLTPFWNSSSNKWWVEAEILPHTASGSLVFRSYIEELEIATRMAQELEEILNDEIDNQPTTI